MYPSFQINGEGSDIADECKDKLYRPETNPSVYPQSKHTSWGWDIIYKAAIIVRLS